MTELHQHTFSWPAGPSKVIVTGTFDNWTKSIELTKTDSGFEKTLGVPWGSKVIYKYLVDGQWNASSAYPQEYDEHGNLNNIYTTPPKPASISELEAPKAAVAEATDSVLASHGTTSIVSYVTSGVGAAIATVTGYDPVNSQKIPVPETPVSETPAAAPVPAPATAKPVDLAPIADEPVVLHLAADSAKAGGSDSRGAEIPNAPEPYKEVNGKLPAELEVPRHSTAAHPSEVVPPKEEEHLRHSTAARPSEVIHKPEPTNTTTTTTTAVESTPAETAAPKTPPPNKEASFPRTSGGSPPTTPRKFSFQRSRGSVSGSIASSDGSSPRKKKHSFISKIKEVFHHHDKHEKPAASP